MNSQETPSLLDIIKIDGRWAQVGNPLDDLQEGSRIKFLDDCSYDVVRWAEVSLKNQIQFNVRTCMELGYSFDLMEIENIHWGPEQNISNDYRLMVYVYAGYQTIRKS